MSDTPQTINGELLRLKRESLGWLVSDLATRACMSIKQIKQLEEGGSSSFYSESVKLTSAKKVGGILGLTQDEVFGVVKQAPEEAAPDTDTVLAELTLETPVQDTVTLHEEPSNVSSPAGVLLEQQPQTESLTEPTLPPLDDATVKNAESSVTEQKSKTPLGAIAALFVAALAVAAWMRPEAEPVAVEPPPPLQTLPAETPDGAASAASAEAAGVPASAASAAASGASPVSPAVTSAQPQASVTPAATKASAASTPPQAPSASTSASKPL